jgi:hypothetical protein
MLGIDMLSGFVTLREKILAFIAYTGIVIATGWHLHTIWDNHMNSDNIKHQLERAKEAPAEISKFNQQLREN